MSVYREPGERPGFVLELADDRESLVRIEAERGVEGMIEAMVRSRSVLLDAVRTAAAAEDAPAWLRCDGGGAATCEVEVSDEREEAERRVMEKVE